MPQLDQQIDDAIREAFRALHASDLVATLNAGERGDPLYRVSRETAHGLALFAKLAYLTLPRHEVEDSGRVSVVPSMGFPAAVREAESLESASTVPVVQERIRAIGGTIFDDRETASRVVSTKRVVVLLTRYRVWGGAENEPKFVTIVAVRGTARLYDWGINLQFNRARWREGVRFHSGFLREAFRVVAPVLGRLLDIGIADSHVVFVGHSLGGAVASLLASMIFDWKATYYGHPDMDRGGLWGWIGEVALRAGSHSRCQSLCVTFGAPRYCNAAALCRMLPPVQYVNAEDIVPRVPPMWAGYANGIQVETLPPSPPDQGEESAMLRWAWSLLRGRCVSQHFIDAYMRNLVSQTSSGTMSPGSAHSA